MHIYIKVKVKVKSLSRGEKFNLIPSDLRTLLFIKEAQHPTGEGHHLVFRERVWLTKPFQSITEQHKHPVTSCNLQGLP